MNNIELYIEFPNHIIHRTLIYSVNLTTNGEVLINFIDYGEDDHDYITSFTLIKKINKTWFIMPTKDNYRDYTLVYDNDLILRIIEELRTYQIIYQAPLKENKLITYSDYEEIIVILPSNLLTNDVIFYSENPHDLMAIFDMLFFKESKQEWLMPERQCYENLTPYYVSRIAQVNLNQAYHQLCLYLNSLAKPRGEGRVIIYNPKDQERTPIMKADNTIEAYADENNQVIYKFMICNNKELHLQLKTSKFLYLDQEGNYLYYYKNIL